MRIVNYRDTQKMPETKASKASKASEARAALRRGLEQASVLSPAELKYNTDLAERNQELMSINEQQGEAAELEQLLKAEQGDTAANDAFERRVREGLASGNLTPEEVTIMRQRRAALQKEGGLMQRAEDQRSALARRAENLETARTRLANAKRDKLSLTLEAMHTTNLRDFKNLTQATEAVRDSVNDGASQTIAAVGAASDRAKKDAEKLAKTIKESRKTADELQKKIAQSKLDRDDDLAKQLDQQLRGLQAQIKQSQGAIQGTQGTARVSSRPSSVAKSPAAPAPGTIRVPRVSSPSPPRKFGEPELSSPAPSPPPSPEPADAAAAAAAAAAPLPDTAEVASAAKRVSKDTKTAETRVEKLLKERYLQLKSGVFYLANEKVPDAIMRAAVSGTIAEKKKAAKSSDIARKLFKRLTDAPQEQMKDLGFSKTQLKSMAAALKDAEAVGQGLPRRGRAPRTPGRPPLQKRQEIANAIMDLSKVDAVAARDELLRQFYGQKSIDHNTFAAIASFIRGEHENQEVDRKRRGEKKYGPLRTRSTKKALVERYGTGFLDGLFG